MTRLNTSINAASPPTISKIIWKIFTSNFVWKVSRAVEMASEPDDTVDSALFARLSAALKAAWAASVSPRADSASESACPPMATRRSFVSLLIFSPLTAPDRYSETGR